MSGSLTQFGIGEETTYGTPVIVDKFYEIVSEDFKGTYARLQAEALSSALVDRSDRFAVSPKGAAGTLTLEPLTMGFGDWLAFAMGTVVTSGPLETNAYTHTATMSDLTGKSLTVQVGRPNDANVIIPWTYTGGKVTSLEFSNQIDQTLRAAIGMDFRDELSPDSPSGAEALATPVLPTGAEILTWAGGTITVGGTVIDVSDVSLKVDNRLKTDRFYIHKGQTKKEPVQDGKRAVTWSFTMPYVDNAFWAKVSAATAAGTFATLHAKWEGPTLLGSTVYPSLEVDIPVAVFDEGGPVVSGPSELTQTFTGRGLYDGTQSAMSILYTTADATVLASA